MSPIAKRIVTARVRVACSTAIWVAWSSAAWAACSTAIWVACCSAIWVASSSAAWGQAQWPYERIAGTFRWHADFPLDKPALLDELVDLQQELVTTLQISPAREPIHLMVFQKKKTYSEYLKRYFPSVPARRALYLKARGPGMVFAYRSDMLAIDVRHEATHALLHAALDVVPLWLDEGLAEYYEVEPEKRVYDHPHLGTTRWEVRFGRQKPLDALEEVTDLSAMGQAEYRRSWAWVHFILHGPPEAKDELARFLADIQAATPPGRLSARLRARIPKLEDRFAEHIRSWKAPSGEEPARSTDGAHAADTKADQGANPGAGSEPQSTPGARTATLLAPFSRAKPGPR